MLCLQVLGIGYDAISERVFYTVNGVVVSYAAQCSSSTLSGHVFYVRTEDEGTLFHVNCGPRFQFSMNPYYAGSAVVAVACGVGRCDLRTRLPLENGGESRIFVLGVAPTSLR